MHRPRCRGRGASVGKGTLACSAVLRTGSAWHRRTPPRLRVATLTGNNIRKVRFAAFALGARGHVHIDYDAYPRSLLRGDGKVKAKRDGWDDDDDRG